MTVSNEAYLYIILKGNRDKWKKKYKEKVWLEDVRVVFRVVFGWTLTHLVSQVDDDNKVGPESDDNQGDGSSRGNTSTLYTFRSSKNDLMVNDQTNLAADGTKKGTIVFVL